MATNHPRVMTEGQTLERLHQGSSIARYGDGEYKLCNFRDCVSQVRNAKLMEELRAIARKGSDENLIVAVPPLDKLDKIPEGKKRGFWEGQVRQGKKHLTEGALYGSSFITRSDNAPHIDTKPFYDRIIDLWRDKDITLVIGSERSLCERNTHEAKSVTYVRGLYRDSYQEIERIQKEIVQAGNNTVILCLGATATVLASRLCKDYHALDLGHVGLKGMFKKAKGLI